MKTSLRLLFSLLATVLALSTAAPSAVAAGSPWSNTASLATARRSHTATLLPNGTARAALNLALQKAVLTVAQNHIGQPGAAAQFFKQSLLENPAASAAAPAPAAKP